MEFQRNKETQDRIHSVANQAIQRKPNKTGLPDNLKSGIENLSGHSMDDVKVHYNSSRPAQLHAHAFAQGNQIHLASGQEKHLPHEAWHVVQQKQGRVKPTMQLKKMLRLDQNSNYSLTSTTQPPQASIQFTRSNDVAQLASKASRMAGGLLVLEGIASIVLAKNARDPKNNIEIQRSTIIHALLGISKIFRGALLVLDWQPGTVSESEKEMQPFNSLFRIVEAMAALADGITNPKKLASASIKLIRSGILAYEKILEENVKNEFLKKGLLYFSTALHIVENILGYLNASEAPESMKTTANAISGIQSARIATGVMGNEIKHQKYGLTDYLSYLNPMSYFGDDKKG
ncbi:DUF4157 domain-containing protein [Ekhidna sp.]|uniref:eCIS core domain-containing protein n=1 Tax=Ekhidna sp. TaxID=2608089 RepID=UPI0032981133